MIGNIQFPNDGEKIIQVVSSSVNSKIRLTVLTNYGNLYNIQ